MEQPKIEEGKVVAPSQNGGSSVKSENIKAKIEELKGKMEQIKVDREKVEQEIRDIQAKP